MAGMGFSASDKANSPLDLKENIHKCLIYQLHMQVSFFTVLNIILLAMFNVRLGLSWFNWWVSFAPEFLCCYFCESSCLFYLSFNFDFYVSKIMHL